MRTLALLGLSSSSLLLVLVGQGCGSEPSAPTDVFTETEPKGSSSGGGAFGGGSSGGLGPGDFGAGGGDLFIDAGSSGGCTGNEACAGGVCTNGVCCAKELACGNVCCNAGQVCSFQQCVVPGAACADSEECGAAAYCEYSLGEPSVGGNPPSPGCVGGVQLPSGKCLPRPPTCAPGMPPPQPDEPLTCLEACQFKSPTAFSPQLKFAWGGQITAPFSTDVMMTPIVLELDDDDCDGRVTAKDIPEIIFSTFTGSSQANYKGPGVLHAISIVEGKVVEKWTLPGVHPTKQLAGGNIDGKPGNEIVHCKEGTNAGARAVRGDGTVLWSTPPMPCFMPSIADLDGDGNIEVIIEGGILDGVTGTRKATFSAQLASSFIVSDIDGNGRLDIVTGSQAYDDKGVLFVNTQMANTSSFYGTEDWKSPWPAVGDFDRDGKPEVVVVDNMNHSLMVWRYDAAAPQKFIVVRSPLDINGGLNPTLCPSGTWGRTHGGGAPTIADFNGDGTPDVAMAGGVGYAVLDGKKLIDRNVAGSATFLWIKQTSDCSSASTGSTVFDFDGDGKAEVVYSDQQRLRIYEGPTGDVLWERCNTTATLIENPIVADVDNDGHADIVAVANAFARANPDVQCNDGGAMAQAGVRIFGDGTGKWVRTRRVWNEHGYHITNVEEDGTIPATEKPNFSTVGLNNFRQNKQPGSEFAAPDAIVSLAPLCGVDYALLATIRNVGEASLPAGVVIGLYKGNHPNGTRLGEVTTSKVLYPAESETLLLPMPAVTPDVASGAVLLYAVADDSGAPHPAWTECRTDNNVSAATSGACETPK